MQQWSTNTVYFLIKLCELQLLYFPTFKIFFSLISSDFFQEYQKSVPTVHSLLCCRMLYLDKNSEGQHTQLLPGDFTCFPDPCSRCLGSAVPKLWQASKSPGGLADPDCWAPPQSFWLSSISKRFPGDVDAIDLGLHLNNLQCLWSSTSVSS